MWWRIILLDSILAMNREKADTLQNTYEGTIPIYANVDHVRNDQMSFPTECQFFWMEQIENNRALHRGTGHADVFQSKGDH